MSSSVKFDYSDKRLVKDAYCEGFELALKIRKGEAFNAWESRERMLLSICCHTTVDTSFMKFPHDEDHRVGRLLRHLFNVRDRRVPKFLEELYEDLDEASIKSIEEIVIPVSLALLRNTPVRPAQMPPIR